MRAKTIRTASKGVVYSMGCEHDIPRREDDSIIARVKQLASVDSGCVNNSPDPLTPFILQIYVHRKRALPLCNTVRPAKRKRDEN